MSATSPPAPSVQPSCVKLVLLLSFKTVKDYEDVAMLNGKKQRLLRVEELADKVMGPQGLTQLPGMTTWLDKDLRPVCSEFEMPLLGKQLKYPLSVRFVCHAV